MGVTVNKNHRVNTGEKVYFPGDFISGLSEKDEQDLIASGVCSAPYVQSAENKDEDPPEGGGKDPNQGGNTGSNLEGDGPNTGLPVITAIKAAELTVDVLKET